MRLSGEDPTHSKIFGEIFFTQEEGHIDQIAPIHYYLKFFQEFHLLKRSSSFLALFSAADSGTDFGALPIFPTFLLCALIILLIRSNLFLDFVFSSYSILSLLNFCSVSFPFQSICCLFALGLLITISQILCFLRFLPDWFSICILICFGNQYFNNLLEISLLEIRFS